MFERKQTSARSAPRQDARSGESVLDNHLKPEFGDVFVDTCSTRSDIKAWQARIAAKIHAGDMAPTTANTILGVLRQITDEAVEDFDIRDPMRGVDNFDTREHSTYTEEEPNSLAPDRCAAVPCWDARAARCALRVHVPRVHDRAAAVVAAAAAARGPQRGHQVG